MTDTRRYDEDLRIAESTIDESTHPHEVFIIGRALLRKEIALQLRILILPALYSGISKMELREFLEGLIERLESDK